MPEWIANLPVVAAWWGAVLSTIMAAIKVWELWRYRFRVEVGGSFTSAADIGNKINILNLSPDPLILTHWEVFYGSGMWPFRRETSICDREYDANNATIASNSTYPLTFANELYFSTTPDELKGRAIYICLHIAGRRSIRRKVYPF
ncbi:MAG: hypothetical protein ABL996_02730 [Micropepsaceae bacterium]